MQVTCSLCKHPSSKKIQWYATNPLHTVVSGEQEVGRRDGEDKSPTRTGFLRQARDNKGEEQKIMIF